RDELKVDRTEEYRQRQFPPATGSIADWRYTPIASPFSDFPYTSSISELMAKNSNARVYVGSGIYDMKTTTGAAMYLVAQSGWPKSRIHLSLYEGGHMAYTNESALKKFTDDIRAMVQGR